MGGAVWCPMPSSGHHISSPELPCCPSLNLVGIAADSFVTVMSPLHAPTKIIRHGKRDRVLPSWRDALRGVVGALPTTHYPRRYSCCQRCRNDPPYAADQGS